MLHLTTNTIISPIIARIKNIDMGRVAAVATPLLSLHPGTALATSIGTVAYRLYRGRRFHQPTVGVGAAFIGAALAGGGTFVMPGLFSQAVLQTLLAFLLIRPTVEWATSHNCTDMQALAQACAICASIFRNRLLLAPLTIVSLLLLVKDHVDRAYALYRDPAGPRYPEILAHLVVAMVHAYRSCLCLGVFGRIMWADPISTHNFDGHCRRQMRFSSLSVDDAKKWEQASCLNEVQEIREKMMSTPVDVAEWLKKQGLPLQIVHGSFSRDDLKNCILRGITFTDCYFKDANFKGVTLENVIFNDCNLKRTQWAGSSLINVFFENYSYGWLPRKAVAAATLNSVSWGTFTTAHPWFYDVLIAKPLLYFIEQPPVVPTHTPA